MAGKPRTQAFRLLSSAQILPQQSFDCFRHEWRRAAKSDWSRCTRKFTHRTAEAEVIGVGHLAFVLDLLSFQANVSDPMLAATIWAASNVNLELLIKLRQPFFHLVHQPARESLGFRDGEFAEFGARAGDRASEEHRAFHMQSNLT